jgi:hypothetical protein
VREGAALLQGLATCGKCGRRLHTCTVSTWAACKSIRQWWRPFSEL